MVDEIKGLLDRGIPAENLIYYGLEYKFITEYVIGKTSYDEDVSRFGNSNPSVCQKADDVVQRYGAQRLYYPLGRCIAANGEKGGDGFGADEELGCSLESGLGWHPMESDATVARRK